jgi:hypothetical protein
MLRKFVCVGFHSSQGEGARAVMAGIGMGSGNLFFALVTV